MWLNYHHLFYFWKIAQTGTLTAAAKELRLAHPTVSAQLKTLEENIGHKLFERVGRNLRLTEMGELTYRYANDIFGLGEELVGVLQGHSQAGEKLFRVGVTDILPKPIAYRFLEPALQLPDTRTIVYEGEPNSLMRQLALHELDLILSDFPMSPQFTSGAFNHLLGESPLTVFGEPTLARRYRKDFPVSLEGAPFLLQTDNTSLRRLLNQWFAGRQLQPRVVAEFEDSELLKEYGQRGGGLFAASTVIEDHTLQHYKVKTVGRIETARMRFYAISPERRVTNPAVSAVIETAKQKVFG